jgi:hypothetical protein
MMKAIRIMSSQRDTKPRWSVLERWRALDTILVMWV